MIASTPRPATARPAAAWAMLGLVLALVGGLVWMHALTGGHHRVDAPLGHGGSVAAQWDGDGGSAGSAEPCDGHDSPSDCPPHQPEHPGPLCQSGAVPGGAVLAVPGPGLTVPAAAPHPVPVSVATVASDAGAGSGCGPPSLTLLSISRT